MTTIATKQTTAPQSLSRAEQPPRTSLAQASDTSKALRLAPTFQPDVDLLTAEGLIAFGVKGSGKSNLLALLVEQFGRFLLPQLILDTEREYQSLAALLPHGVIATAERCPSGSDILSHCLQVILDKKAGGSSQKFAWAPGPSHSAGGHHHHHRKDFLQSMAEAVWSKHGLVGFSQSCPCRSASARKFCLSPTRALFS